MNWKNGNVQVSHPREPWGEAGVADILVNCRLDNLKGTAPGLGRPALRYKADYEAAKFSFDLEAAFRIVDRCANDRVVDRLVDVILASPVTPRLIVPHPAFDDDDAIGNQEPIKAKPTNALPFAYAGYLAEILGCEVDETIVQNARVGRTKLTHWLRFLCQPSFVGEVPRGQPYIIVDDVVTTGGTLAALRGFILRSGGTVLGTSALAHNSGNDQAFGVAPDTLRMLKSLYTDQIGPYWTDTFGHDLHCLTEVEAQILAGYARVLRQRHACGPGAAMLDGLRSRVNAAAAKGG